MPETAVREIYTGQFIMIEEIMQMPCLSSQYLWRGNHRVYNLIFIRKRVELLFVGKQL